MKEIEKSFVYDLVFLLREKRDESKKDEDLDDLEMGKRLAYSDVLSLIYQQAIAFGIDLNDIGMTDHDPEIG